MIKIKKGNIFTTNLQTIVNTVNSVGIMGAGIAYEFRIRFPDMFNKYKIFCDNGQLDIGKLWIYKIKESNNENYEFILNFPTKKHWKDSTKREYLERGLEKFVNTYQEKGIISIAFPLLGAGKGGLKEEESISIIKKYLKNIDIPIEIWYFDSTAEDDLYRDFRDKFLNLDNNKLKEQSNLRMDLIDKIKSALERDDINSLSGLLTVKGIGAITIEKSFKFIKKTHY